MREDKEGASVEFDNMQMHQLSGTTDWKEYSVTLRISRVADQLFIGALVTGTGKA